MRVLIVDDNRVSILVLRNALVTGGHDVVSADNGLDALRILQGGSCRLVISDVEMPEMDGIDLCRAIRADGRNGYVYVMLLTGHDDPQDRVAGRRAGADDFISKPFDPQELLARVETAERILSLETRDVAIFALAKLAESRDPETGTHLERVRAYSHVLAEHLSGQERFRDKVNAEYVRLIYLTSPLHDIGKVGIPDCVLLKPGRLSDREFEIMKTHSMLGAQTLDAALQQFPGVKFLQMARDIAASHHERFDGTGYPNRLAGPAIPLCGRIVALADVYDAMTSKRVYKGASTHQVAFAMIVSEINAHFDPEIVEAFEAHQCEFIAIRQDFIEREAAMAA